MDRRDFLGYIFLAGLTLLELTGCVPNPDTGPSTVSPGPKTPAAASLFSGLIIAQGNTYADLLEKGFQAMGGIDQLIRNGCSVVIKPNFTFPLAPEAAATTNPQLVGELVKRCLKAGAREVKVIEHTFGSAAMCLEITGTRREVEAAGGKVYPLNKVEQFKEVPLRGPTLASTKFSKDILDADVFINVPILKHHDITRISASLKNMMGAVWDRNAFHNTNLHKAIAELAAYKKPDLIIMDAVRVLTDNGPQGPGTIKEFNQLVFGTDPVAVDAYGARLFGLQPAEVKHLKNAASIGVGSMDFDKLQLKQV